MTSRWRRRNEEATQKRTETGRPTAHQPTNQPTIRRIAEEIMRQKSFSLVAFSIYVVRGTNSRKTEKNIREPKSLIRRDKMSATNWELPNVMITCDHQRRTKWTKVLPDHSLLGEKTCSIWHRNWQCSNLGLGFFGSGGQDASIGEQHSTITIGADIGLLFEQVSGVLRVKECFLYEQLNLVGSHQWRHLRMAHMKFFVSSFLLLSWFVAFFRDCSPTEPKAKTEETPHVPFTRLNSLPTT